MTWYGWSAKEGVGSKTYPFIIPWLAWEISLPGHKSLLFKILQTRRPKFARERHLWVMKSRAYYLFTLIATGWHPTSPISITPRVSPITILERTRCCGWKTPNGSRMFIRSHSIYGDLISIPLLVDIRYTIYGQCLNPTHTFLDVLYKTLYACCFDPLWPSSGS